MENIIVDISKYKNEIIGSIIGPITKRALNEAKRFKAKSGFQLNEFEFNQGIFNDEILDNALRIAKEYGIKCKVLYKETIRKTDSFLINDVLIKFSSKKFGNGIVFFMINCRNDIAKLGIISLRGICDRLLTESEMINLFRSYIRILFKSGLIKKYNFRDVDDVYAKFVLSDSVGRIVKTEQRIRNFRGGEYKFPNYKELMDKMLYFLSDYSQENILILSGPPGTGKTTLIADALREYQRKIGRYDLSRLGGILVVLDASSLHLIIQDILRSKVTIIENSEQLLMSRKHSNAINTIRTLIEITDGLFSSSDSCKIIASLNTADSIDPALLRLGRGELIEIPEISLEFVKEKTFKYALQELKKFGIDPEKDFDHYWNRFRKIITTGKIRLADVFGITQRLVIEERGIALSINEPIREKRKIGFQSAR